MKLSGKSIEYLVGVITGDTGKSPYRSGPTLINFFNGFGGEDTYGEGFPSRHQYVREKLWKLNESNVLTKVIPAAFDFFDAEGFDPKVESDNFNMVSARDGFRLKRQFGASWVEDGEIVNANPYFEIIAIGNPTVEPHSLLLTEESLKQHSIKVMKKIDEGDFSGAITNCYTLTEEFLKLLLAKNSISCKETEGDIKKLYGLYAGSAGLKAQNDVSPALKPLLSGLNSLVSGFYEIANKASDRHKEKYSANRHHSKFVANMTFVFCEFLLESENHRKKSK